MADLNWYVESVDNGRGSDQDEGGWTATNSVPTSNHLGGTAFDYNWSDHPMGPQVPDEAAGWQWSEIVGGPEESRVRELLDYYEGTVFWGNDWDNPHDSMHFQMGYNTYGNPHTQDFINRKIDLATGFSRFHDEHKPKVDLALLLSQVMGSTPGVDYSQYVDLWIKCLRDAKCNNVNRISMLAAQLGTESAGLKYMEEIADGSQYEGRTDLGNTHPGDGIRFKGRGPIQVTGRLNYGKFSQWAFDNGIVDTSTYFIDNPTELAKPKYGFEAVVWYWIAARPTLNEVSDAGDVVQATKLVNGGSNGLQDRQFRYNNCINMGQRLMEFVNQQPAQGDWMSQIDADRLNAAIDKILGGGTMPAKWISRSMFADSAVPVDDTVGMLLNIDGNAWNVENILGVLLGVPYCVDQIHRMANGDFPSGTPVAENEWLRNLAIAFAKALEPLAGSLSTFLSAVNEQAAQLNQGNKNV